MSKLPDVADSIFWMAVISTGSFRAMAPSWPNLSWLWPSGAITCPCVSCPSPRP